MPLHVQVLDVATRSASRIAADDGWRPPRSPQPSGRMHARRLLPDLHLARLQSREAPRRDRQSSNRGFPPRDPRGRPRCPRMPVTKPSGGRPRQASTREPRARALRPRPPDRRRTRAPVAAPPCLPNPCLQRLGRAADPHRDRYDRNPLLSVFLCALPDHPHGALLRLGRVAARSRHRPTPSTRGASGEPGAVEGWESAATMPITTTTSIREPRNQKHTPVRRGSCQARPSYPACDVYPTQQC